MIAQSTSFVNGGAGRDHWAPVMSCMIAGGGLQMGQVIGRSDSTGSVPAADPYGPPNLMATVAGNRFLRSRGRRC